MIINFNNFIANEQTKAAITAAFVKDRLPQAIILQGDDGLGKKTLAKIIANIAVCTSNEKPCGVCPACTRAKAGSHPDIRIETGSGVSGNISVDSIRQIISDIQKKPEEADMNIYLLFIKNTMSEASQNKLLKIMEEPPGKALFIITVSSAQSLLPTIRSRAVCFTLLPPSIEDSAQFVHETTKIDYSQALELAKIHGANIGSMLSGEALPVKTAQNIAQIFDNNDEDSLLALCYPLIKDRKLFALCLEQFRAIIRDAIIFSECSNPNFKQMGTDKEQSIRISNKYRKVVLLQILEICGEFIDLSKKNLNMNLLVTDFCAKLREVILK